MPVLSVAQSQHGETEGASGDGNSASDTPGSSSDSADSSGDAETVDIAERIDTILSNFVTGLIPGDYKIRIDWGMLSNIAGAVSYGIAVYAALSARI